MLCNIVNIDCVRVWSDSSIVLVWLNGDQKQFKIFVTDRVSKICSLLPQCEWTHQSSQGSQENTVNSASQSGLPRKFLTNLIHLDGPEFLYNLECQWPNFVLAEMLPERFLETKNAVKSIFHVQESIKPADLIIRLSALTKMQHVLAYCFRFAVRSQKGSTSAPITWAKYNRELNVAILCTQKTYVL